MLMETKGERSVNCGNWYKNRPGEAGAGNHSGALRKFNHKDAEIKVIIMDEFGLTEQEAVEYF